MQACFAIENDKKIYKRNVQGIDIHNDKYVFRIRDNGFTIIKADTMEVLVNKKINLCETLTIEKRKK